MAKGSNNPFPSVLLVEQAATPAGANLPDSGEQRVYMKTDHKFYKVNSSGSESEIGAGGVGGSAPDYAQVQDQKTSGTSGGTFTAGALRTRDLNTIVKNEGSHISLNSNQITIIDAGTYEFEIMAVAVQVGHHQAVFANITDSINYYGTTMYAISSTYEGYNFSVVKGKFTLSAGGKVFEVRHQCDVTRATWGFGDAGSFGNIEIYTDVVLRKLA